VIGFDARARELERCQRLRLTGLRRRFDLVGTHAHADLG
jgi:hypothetical protein